MEEWRKNILHKQTLVARQQRCKPGSRRHLQSSQALAVHQQRLKASYKKACLAWSQARIKPDVRKEFGNELQLLGTELNLRFRSRRRGHATPRLAKAA